MKNIVISLILVLMAAFVMFNANRYVSEADKVACIATLNEDL